MKLKTYILLYLWMIACLMQQTFGRQNVLLILVDDLRPEIGAYMDDDALYPEIRTPNIDAFAEQSLVLTRAFTNYPLCSPSRTSFLTGRRPDTTKVYDFEEYWRNVGGNFTSIPQYFKENGYESIGMGKVYHHGYLEGEQDGDFSWTQDHFLPDNSLYWNSYNKSWKAITEEEEIDRPLPDSSLRDHALLKLEELAPAAVTGETPFFMAIGFYKPHLPLNVPEYFYELYPKEEIYLPENPYVIQNYPEVALNYLGDLSYYEDILALNITGGYNETLPDAKVLELRRAYYAAVSYTDSLIGDVLTSLNTLNLTQNTVVVITADHGYHLGEHASWTKMTNLDLDIRVPFLIKIPGITDEGMVSDALVEMVDLFPTLVDASGLPTIPQCPENSTEILVCHEGLSLLKLAMGLVHDEDWKNATFSQYAPYTNAPGNELVEHIGNSIREQSYRYTRWISFIDGTMNWDIVYGLELYDLESDPNELVNVAYDPEYVSVVERLDERLRKGWRFTLPEI